MGDKPVVSQLPPFQEPFLDTSGRMTLPWRRFLETQWLRSGGFSDDIFAATFSSFAISAQFNELRQNLEDARSEVAELRAQLASRPNYEDEIRELHFTIAQAYQQQEVAIQQLEIIREQARTEQLQIEIISATQSQSANTSLKYTEQDIIDVDQRVDSLTTTNVPEGSRLYFTTARARGSVSALGDLSYNVSTGEFSYTTPTNSGTATKWQTPRTLSYTGDVTGSNTVDGSADVAFAMTIKNDVALGGNPTTTTQTFGNSTTRIATTAFVQTALNRSQTTINTDADFTLTAHTSAPEIKHTGTLTADRTVTLSTSGAVAGDKFYITRTGSGAFNLIVGGLKNLATNTYAAVTFDGAAWYLSEYGAL